MREQAHGAKATSDAIRADFPRATACFGCDLSPAEQFVFDLLAAVNTAQSTTSGTTSNAGSTQHVPQMAQVSQKAQEPRALRTSQISQEAQASQASRGPHMPQVPDGLWDDVRAELLNQAVHCIPADYMEEIGLTPAQQQRYLSDVATNMSSWYGYMGAQANVLTLLEHANIPVVVLKGAAASAQYPRPEYRCMGDIDLLVPPAHYGRALALLREDGWCPMKKDESTARCKKSATNSRSQQADLYERHVALFKKGCPEIELHRFFDTEERAKKSASEKNAAGGSEVGKRAAFCNVPMGSTMGSTFDERIFSAIERREHVQVNGFRVPMLPVFENGLVLLSHIDHHLYTGLGLRQVLDWQMFVETYLSDDFWHDGFGDACRQIGLETLAITVTKLCREHLGLQRRITWCNGADDALVNELAAYVAHRGNMGNKESRVRVSVRRVLLQLRSPARGVRYLYEAGKLHWEPGRQHAWLAPATCLYQVGYLMRRGLAGGTSTADVTSAFKNSKQDDDLLTRLGARRG